MKTEIIKIVIEDRVFIKTINYFNGIIYSIIVYELFDDGSLILFSEHMADIKLRGQIQSNDYNVDCSQNELVEFYNKIVEYNKYVEEKCRETFKTVKLYNDSEILLFDNMAGLNYVLFKDKSDMRFLFEVRIENDEMVLYTFSERYISSVTMDAYSKLSMKEKDIEKITNFCVYQDEKTDVFISCIVEGKYIYFIFLNIDKINLTIRNSLSTILKITKEGLKLIVPTEDMDIVIQRIMSTARNNLVEKFCSTIVE